MSSAVWRPETSGAFGERGIRAPTWTDMPIAVEALVQAQYALSARAYIPSS